MALRATSRQHAVDHLDRAERYLNPARAEDDRPDIEVLHSVVVILRQLMLNATVVDGAAINALQLAVNEHQWLDPAVNHWVGGRAAIGAVAVGGFFYVLWRLTGGIGFGDVRLMVTVGAVTAAASASVAFNAVLLGSIVGAVWGIVRLRIKGPGPFPYGPALWSGPFLALALDAVSSWAIQSAR